MVVPPGGRDALSQQRAALGGVACVTQQTIGAGDPRMCRRADFVDFMAPEADRLAGGSDEVGSP